MVHNVLFFMLNIPFQIFQRCSSLLSLIFFIFYILTKRVHCELFQLFFLFPQILLPPFSVVLGIHVVPRAIKLHSRIQCLLHILHIFTSIDCKFFFSSVTAQSAFTDFLKSMKFTIISISKAFAEVLVVV